MHISILVSFLPIKNLSPSFISQVLAVFQGPDSFLLNQDFFSLNPMTVRGKFFMGDDGKQR